jgi:hypothetical protein
MIPQEKSEAVARGLREAFGVTEFGDTTRITRGRTPSLVFASSCAARHTC